MSTLISAQNIEQKISQFKDALAVLSIQDATRRYILHGDCYILTTDQYFNLKKKVTEHFMVDQHEVLAVGSIKLGFSIVPKKLFRHFSDGSDIDIAIINEALFDNIWKSVHDYWKSGGFWTRKEIFQDYLFQGWIRPDQLPPSSMFPLANDWWEFFRSITESGDYGPYQIRGAIYKSFYFLESYQQKCIEYCQQIIRGTL